jgi:hypothetical protein
MRHESRLGGKANMPRGPKSERGSLVAGAVAEAERSRLYIVGIRKDTIGGSQLAYIVGDMVGTKEQVLEVRRQETARVVTQRTMEA